MKKIFRKLLLNFCLLFLLTCGICIPTKAASYPSIMLDVPYFPQKISGDCGISSISMIEAYALGYGCSCYDAIYEAVYVANGNDLSIGTAVNNGQYKDVSRNLETIYNQLAAGNPVLIYRGSSSYHWSVIVGYNGSSTTLQKSGFIVYNTAHDVEVGKPYISSLENWLSGNNWMHAKVRVTGAISGITQQVSTLTLKNVYYPSNLKIGNGMGSSGLLISNGNITNVSAGVKTTGGTVKFSASATPNSKYFGLMNLDGSMKFGSLSAGTYIYYVTASDSTGATLKWEQQFTVSSSSTSLKATTVDSTTNGNVAVAPEFPLIHDGIYRIKNVNSGKYIDILEQRLGNEVDLHQWAYAHTNSQLWRAVQHGDGYSFISVHSGKAMDVYLASASAGADIHQYTYDACTAQRFKLYNRGNGSYSIHPLCSNLALDIYGSSTDNGAKLKQYAYHGGANQLFSFEAVDTTAPTISNVQVTNVTRDGYTVTCYVEDNAGGVGVERVSFPTWSDVNGQDDLSSDWYNVCAVYPSGTGNTYTFNVNVANHGYAEGGYTTHIYAYDKLGNCSSAGTTAYINRQIALQSFTLSANNINLNINQTQQLSVTSYTPSDTTVDKTATWQSSDSTVATVDSQGNVKALKAGTATITCTVAGKTKTCTVKVAKAGTESSAKITKQPSSQKAKEGKTVTFTVKTSGNGLTYQWQVSKNNGKKWSNSSLTGNKTSKLKVKATKGRNGYQFRCIVKDKNGNTITSKAVKLTVTSNVKITKQPSSQKVKKGKTATFTVKASGTKLTYQWQVSKDNGKKWSNTSSSGSKTSKLKVKAIEERNGYKFRCIIKDKNGKKVTSKAVKLTVTTNAKTTKYASNFETDNTTITNENIEIIEEIIENSVSANDISVSSGDSLSE